MQQTSVCFDTETTGLKALEIELIGIAFSYEIGKGYYVSFPENQEETKAILEEFRPFFASKEIKSKISGIWSELLLKEDSCKSS